VTHLPFFLASFVWNYGLGMTWLAVPLYAHAQGLSGAEIGVLFSAPVAAQIAINLLGGAYVDRVGGRLIVLASCWLLALAGLELVFAQGFWALFAGQLLLVVARAAFWPANWSMATELPGDRSVQVGRLNAVTNLGQILGNASCGFILATAGFDASFLVLAAMGVASALLAQRTPTQSQAQVPGRGLFANYRQLLGLRVLYYAVMCAYLSALPFSLSMSFYPLLLQQFGYGEEASGILIALRAVGGIGAGLLVARFVKTGPDSYWPVYAGVSVALSVGLMPVTNHWLALGAFLLIVGVGSGMMTVYFQLTMGEMIAPRMRGSAMALGGLGWGVSHFSTPLAMGFLADRYGLVSGFYVLGVAAIAVSGVIAVLRHWAFVPMKAAQ